MRKLIILPFAVIALAFSGCEFNGLSSRQISRDILKTVNQICGYDREHGRGGVENIMLMEDRQDDGIVTCHDGTNHYFDA